MIKRFLLFSFLLLASYLSANDKKRIFILHSYSQEYGWTKSQHDSFVEKLQELSPSALEFSVEYLDTKRLKFSKEYQSFYIDYLQKKYKEYHPDAIYVTDDNALTFFRDHEKSLFSDVPLFFSGVNDVSSSPYLDRSKYVGVFETKEISQNIELIRQFSPQTRDVWIVGDNSATYRSIEDEIRKQIPKYPKCTFHFIASAHIDEIMKQLPSSRKSFVLLATIGELRDAEGHVLTLTESIKRLKQNPNIILCSMEDAYMLGGVVGGYVTSGVKQGQSAAELVIRYFGGEDLTQIRSIEKSPNVYMFDRKELVNARLILSEYIARNSTILHEEKTFFERHQNTILNGAFIIFVFFLVVVVILFFVIVQKNDQLKKYQAELEDATADTINTKEHSHSNVRIDE